MRDPGKRPRRHRVPLGAVVPFALLVAAAAAWSLAWYLRAEDIVARLGEWRSWAAQHGTILVCEEEATGGYPFRFTFECTSPVVTVGAGAGSHRLVAQRLHAVALIYDPRHVIIEIDTPAEIRAPDRRMLAAGGEDAMRASVELTEGRLGRLSVVLPAIEVMQDGPGGPFLTAEWGEIHMRLRRDEAALDLALKSGAAKLLRPDHGDHIDIDSLDAVAVINDLPDADAADFGTWLEAWRAGGGIAEIQRLSFDSPELGGDAAGTVNLTAAGLVEGALDARLTKIDAFIDALERRGVIDANQKQILRGAAGIFASVSEGRPTVRLAVRVRDGEIYLGPVRVATLPPLI